MAFYPININICGRPVVVIGGGSVAARKVESLLVCGARITVISPEFCDKLKAFHQEGKVTLVKRKYRNGDLTDSLLAFAATDQPEVQKEIMVEAMDRSILINVADSNEDCSFQVPSSLRRGELLITVSTGGGSPLLAAKIRNELEEEYGDDYGLLVRLFSLLRKQLLGFDQAEVNMKKLFEKLLALNILVLIRKKEWEKVRDVLTEELTAQVDIDGIMKEIQD